VSVKNTVISGALETIRRIITEHEKVLFVIHFWMPFSNLWMGGFRFPQVPDPYIPSGVLIPLVDTPQKHLDSFTHPITNKVNPFEVEYMQKPNASLIDLQRRYGRYGLVKVEGAECTLNEATDMIEGFNLVFNEFNAPLQNLSDFFGFVSPVEMQFDNPIARCKTTYSEVLDKLANSGRISELVYHRLLASIGSLQQSVEVAHRCALVPEDGILTRSIREINQGDKAGLDMTDIWLTKHFPDFKVGTRLKGKEDVSTIDKLVNVLTDRLSGQPVAPRESQPISLIDMLRVAKPEELALLRSILNPTDVPPSAMQPGLLELEQPKPSIAAPEPSSVDTGGEEDEPEITPFHEMTEDDAQGAVVATCFGLTKGSGYTERCKSDAREGKCTCYAHDDQEKMIVEIGVEAAAAKLREVSA